MAKFDLFHSIKKTSLALSTGFVLAGCATDNAGYQLTSAEQNQMRETIVNSSMRNKPEILAGVDLLIAGKYNEASRSFNRALMDDPKSAELHFLNALTYHMQSEAGYGDKYDLAISGYLNAIAQDPSNWQPFMHMGRIYMHQREFHKAQEAFASVVLLNSDNKDALHDLAVASYYARDVEHAYNYINLAIKKDPTNLKFHRTAAIIAAAANEKEESHKHYKMFLKSDYNPSEAKYVSRRIQDWEDMYASGRIDREIAKAEAEQKAAEDAKVKLELAKAKKAAEQTKYTFTSAEQEAPAAPPEPATAPPTEEAVDIEEEIATEQPISTGTISYVAEESQPDVAGGRVNEKQAVFANTGQMVVLDGVVMRVSEEGTTQKGNNIMNMMNAALTISSNTTLNRAFTLGQAATRTETQQHILGGRLFTGTAGTVNYSLNIANAFSNYIEVVGRPTLAVQIGKSGAFYSGDTRYLPITGDRGGSIEKLPVGITLEVTPTDIDGDIVTLQIRMVGQSVLTDVTENVNNQYLVVADSYVQTEVKAKIGETVVLGGIKLRSDNFINTGFPLLKDLPGVQYLFSDENTSNSRRTVVYMVTVRGYGKDIQKANEQLEKEGLERPTLTELDERYRQWFRPRSNVLAMMRTLAPVYHEFRTGDIEPIKWSSYEDPGTIFRQLASFLYY